MLKQPTASVNVQNIFDTGALPNMHGETKKKGIATSPRRSGLSRSLFLSPLLSFPRRPPKGKPRSEGVRSTARLEMCSRPRPRSPADPSDRRPARHRSRACLYTRVRIRYRIYAQARRSGRTFNSELRALAYVCGWCGGLCCCDQAGGDEWLKLTEIVTGWRTVSGPVSGMNVR